MSSHPGSTIKDAIDLACFLKENSIRPEQVQDFYPTPGTISTCMFYTGLDPYTLEPIYVARTSEEKSAQRALLQYFMPKNQRRIIEILEKAGRRDLIGNANNCLVKPDNEYLLKQQKIKQGGAKKDTKRASRKPTPNSLSGGNNVKKTKKSKR